MDYINAIHKFIDPIVNSPEKVEITELPNDSQKDRTFLITCDEEDAGRLIGKHGATADALREVLSVAGKTNGERIHIKFTSLKATKEAAE